jgi:hypothetical protein
MSQRGKLGNQAEVFAQQLSDTINSVIDGKHQLMLQAVQGRYVLEPKRRADGEKMPCLDLHLPESTKRIGRLQFRYEMTLDHQHEYLKVVLSNFAIRAEADGTALIRLDYEPINMQGTRAPVSHWQIQAHHNALANWLTLAHATQRRSGNQSGRVDKIHLAVGGERFRPCMEDLLHLLVTDLGVATKNGHMRAIQEGRARWRELQLRSAVRDNPAIAAEVLANCGYDVTPVEPKASRPDKHTHY